MFVRKWMIELNKFLLFNRISINWKSSSINYTILIINKEIINNFILILYFSTYLNLKSLKKIKNVYTI